uniref:Centrosomal protein of 76 kDa n=1 Tax=Hucho hucho TaxID=62062 RepID=A0A4W5NXZ6_9TELE
MNIHGKIRDVLAETVREDLDPGHSSLSEEDFLRALQRRGIVDDVMKDLYVYNYNGHFSIPKPATHFIDKDPTKLKKTNMDPARRYLYLQVLGGKAFLEHLQEQEPLPGQVCSTFTLYLHFRNQRFRSKPVPCACEPDLQEGFLLEIHREELGTDWFTSGLPDITQLVYCRQHLVLFTSKLGCILTLLSSLQDENGVNRPVCSYVRVLRAGRLLESPRQAARFVSLLGLEKAPVVGGGGKQEQWCSLLAFLCRSKGDCEDHATLLCSLLLGFGLDAYVCVGTKPKGLAHTWVMTRGTDGTITFWESLTAHRHSSDHFHSNAASLQLREFFETKLPLVVARCCSSCKGVVAKQFSVCPQDLGLATVWDDHLSYVLSSALAAYELERCTGTSCGNEEFQDAVRRAVPDGHTFKGFPIHFLHHNARRTFATCLRSPFCDEIVCCRGDHVRLAVRVRVFAYPESACAVWVMFACKYRCVL